MNNYKYLPAILSLALLSACQANKIYYASEGHFGVDISGTATAPTNFSVSGTSTELSIVPAKSDGSSHTIFGGLEVNLKYLTPGGNKIKQKFATGEAAVCALYSSELVKLAAYISLCKTINSISIDLAPAAVTEHRDRTLVVVTRSLIGLDFHYGEAEAVGSNFGYKRLVAAAIPITTSSNEVGSVYVDISVDSLTSADDCGAQNLPDKENCSLDGGMKISQTIATGISAKLMAIARREKLVDANSRSKPDR